MNSSFHSSMEDFDELWRREESLRRADELIRRSGGRVRAVSFDFFDTIVWRPVAKPTDVFCEVARRLHAENLLPATVTPEDYEVLRRHAEIKTREHQITKDPSREDISIHDIYGHLKMLIKDSEAAVRIEHSAECDLCVLNPVMAGFIRHARALGLKTLIVSDIYFSADQLKEILRANHFDPGLFDLALTSCDEGLCKGTGNLFKRALKMLKLEPEQMIHVGDNFLADVTGARKAGVRGCHYAQTSRSMRTILDREQFLLGGQSAQFSANSLRNMAARLFPAGTDEGFFGRAGAFLMGPLLTRYAGWACEQFVAAGVRKVGALMREGELFGQLLQHEAEERGFDLAITPLYLNRRSTDLAAIGKLTADNLIAWLEARCTLPVGGILKQFGLGEADFRKAPIALDEKADRPEKIVELARFLFTPQIAKRIEARSAEERRKLVDYLQPWLEGGKPLGVCDIGYSASAQTQLKHILDLEKVPTHVIGCYLVSYERAADRILDGVDIRHYLGAFGHPDFYFRAFVRSPAFMEQSLVAAIGTTLGYERQADGTVAPVLDRMPYNDTMVSRQQYFKQGVLEFQKLWHWVRRLRPGLLDGGTEFSRRVLKGIDSGFAPILGRATAFPIPEEVERFGSLALDDHYFAESYKPLCGENDLEDLHKNGYAHILGEAGVHWPHGVFHKDKPRVSGEFFSVGRSLLLCNTESDDGGRTPDVTVVLHAGSQPAILRECLDHLKTAANSKLELEVVLLMPDSDRAMFAAAYELGRHIMPVRICERPAHQTPLQQMNLVADSSQAPFLLFADAGVLLSPGWAGPLLKVMYSGLEIGAVLPQPQPRPNVEKDFESCAPRCLLVRRTAFAEGLGFDEKFTVTGAAWNFLMHLQALKYEIAACPDVVAELRRSELSGGLAGSDRVLLSRRWPALEAFVTQLNGCMTAPAQNNRAVSVDWIGSFLDHGSLSHVNREMTAALQTLPGIHLQRVSNGAAAVTGFEKLACEISATASSDAVVTVRHAWPPDWKRPQNGKLAVIQPWEFGALPEQWIKASASVDEFWVPSEYVRHVYVESGVAADKVVVVPNGVDPEKFNPQAAPMKLATRKIFKFLFVGGTIFRKGPDLLLKAYLENFTAADDVCLVIKDFGGKTVYAGQTFEAQIRAAQAQPNAPEILYLNGEMPPESLPGLYTACDCLVLPYRGEGFGLPALEAMACGLSVIVTAGGATDDFVQDDFGWRIPARRGFIGREISGMKLSGPGWLLEPDGVALGRFLREAFANPAETHRRGQLGALHARECCSWQKSAAIAAVRIRELASKSSESNAPGHGPQPVSTNKPPKSALLKKSVASKVKITLPPCALVGHLAGAREMVRQKNLRGAWKVVLEMLAQRPFHPEAYLELAEIANIAGDGQQAKLCAEHARRIAPGWKPAKKFLNQRLKGAARLEWMKWPDEIGNPKPEIRNRLSVCLIVKNEERFIGRCLKSVQGLASQIVVVDTGSTDRTVDIAKEHGAEIHLFAWCDDFSAARNAALEHATGDWVLVLDADEELSADGREKVKQAMNDAAVMAWRLPLINVGREAEGCSYVPRLFRNAPGLFYIGRVHEQVFSSIEVRRAEWGLENRIGDATLLHYGYTAEMTRDRNKVERNLRLLEKAIEELPDEPHLLMNYGLELARSGRETEALARYQEAFNSLSSKPAAEIVPELRESLLTQFCTRLTAARQFDTVVRVLTSPLAAMNGGLTASLHFSLGLAHLELKQFRGAADQMGQCLAKRSQNNLTPLNPEINTAAPSHCLALCLAKSGDAAAAEKAFQDGLKETGHGDELRLDYARFLVEQNRPVDALGQLNDVVAKNALHLGAWQLGGQIALSRPEFLEFAGDWTLESMRHAAKEPVIVAQRAEALMLSGDTAGALELWRRILDPTSPPAVLAALILCETVELPATHALQEGRDEADASRAFIMWYQKLMSVKARTTILRLNEQTDKLSRALPGAARMLEAAMAEASRAGASAKV
jgi:glycosyltransferase involved in cell wall biosynthesis/FMN phosphatase YigB (HAD superfamily)/tetratricopeptide (TPR) repeat protein